MKKKLSYILSTIILSLGMFVFANTIFNIDDNFFVKSVVDTGSYSMLHFNYGGNNFDGVLFLGTGLNQTGQLTLSGEIINCDKQLNGFYINTARGNNVWPIDQQTLDAFSGSSSLSGYDDLTMTGGFFTQCTGNNIENDKIYGYKQHTYMSNNYRIRAGIEYNLTGNTAISNWSGTMTYIPGTNTTSEGYMFDNYGGIAKVYSNTSLHGDIVFTGTNVGRSGSSRITTYTGIQVNLMSNKNAQFEITGDVVYTLTGYLTGGLPVDKNILLTSNTGTKNLYLEISTGSETYSQMITLTLNGIPTTIETDNTAPIVSLISPTNDTTLTTNNVTLEWTGNDNVEISGYSLYLSSSRVQYSWPDLNSSISGKDVGSIGNGIYTWYVMATDTSGNTGQSTTGNFTISGSSIGPNLISPASGSNINIGEVSLLWQALAGATSGYNRQISTNNTFTNVVDSGSTNNTGTTITHHPSFMTGNFFWRIIDKKTAGVSEHRTLNIIDLISGVDTKVEQFHFNTITGANLSHAYSSNTGTITGLTNNVFVLARLESNIGALFVNNIMVGTEYLVKNNDKIRVELISKNIYNTGVSAKLIVGTGSSLMSGVFEIYTMIPTNTEIGSIPYTLRIQAIQFIDGISEIYKYNPQKLQQFLNTFKAILKDKSDTLSYSISNTTNTQEKELMKIQKNSIDYLYFVINQYINNIDYSHTDIYIAPNGKEYLVEYNDNRLAYTSPNFNHSKFFPTRESFKRHIDINNPGNYYDGIIGDNITTPNGNKYTIYIDNNKWTSDDMIYKKYFDNREQIIEYIMINNPSATWDHNIDTTFNPIVFVAPNGKKYTIFKTSSTGNNANKYSSFGLVSPKYFGSLNSIKEHINQNNK